MTQLQEKHSMSTPSVIVAKLKGATLIVKTILISCTMTCLD